MSLSAIAAALEQFCLWTWKTSLQASVLIALVSVIQFAFGNRLPVRLRYAFSLLVLLRLILPVAPATRFSVFNLGKHLASALPALEIRPTTSLPAPSSAQTIHTPVKLTTAPVKASRFSVREVANTAWLSGLIVSLFVVLRQHRKFSRWIRAGPPLDDPRLAALLEECKTTMRVRREVRLILASQRMTPALFGLRKPCLLLPDGLVQKLDERELRMVFLHELAHVKRGDILLNWVIIFARSLHWFNPLVWLAMGRLRADRELVCDAMVMSHLAVDERRAYGDTLIKLLDDFSDSGFCPGLAPIINHKHEIKRRVTMIAKFRPAGRVALLLSAMLLCAICFFTFTRAAEKRPDLERRDKAGRETRSVDDGNQRDDPDSLRTPSIKRMKNRLDELDQRIRKAELTVDELLQKYLIPSQVAEGNVEGGFAPETIQRLEASRIEVDSKFRGLSELLAKLKELKAEGSDKLRKAMLTVHYDPQLGKLLEDLWTTETTLAKLKETMGRDHPEFRSVSAMRDNLDKRVDERIEGILSGLQAQAAANRAQLDSMANAVDDAKRRDAESAATYRPYFQAKRDLESLQKVRDALYLKLLEQEYGVEVLKAKTKDP